MPRDYEGHRRMVFDRERGLHAVERGDEGRDYDYGGPRESWRGSGLAEDVSSGLPAGGRADVPRTDVSYAGHEDFDAGRRIRRGWDDRDRDLRGRIDDGRHHGTDRDWRGEWRHAAERVRQSWHSNDDDRRRMAAREQPSRDWREDDRRWWNDDRGDDRQFFGRDRESGWPHGRGLEYRQQGEWAGRAPDGRIAGDWQYERGPNGERAQPGTKWFGRGPKNYQRSDERIREDVNETLHRCPFNSENVDVAVKGGEVTLTGFVDSRRDKRDIEEVVEECFGVKDVHNQLRVGRPAMTGDVTTASKTTGRA